MSTAKCYNYHRKNAHISAHYLHSCGNRKALQCWEISQRFRIQKNRFSEVSAAKLLPQMDDSA